VLVLRFAFVLAVMTLVVWLLLSGQPLGALAVFGAGLWLRRAADSGRLAGVASGLRHAR
jgi:hypothetical protein